MADFRRKFKTFRRYHDPGDLHALTFSCYRRMPLLTNGAWRTHLSDSIREALAAFDFELNAFVFMPEHVHMLVFPTRGNTTHEDISSFLGQLKQNCSKAVKADLERSGNRLLQTLTIRERPGKMAFRFWQEGPGYDDNLRTAEAVDAAIAYFHMNPVRRGLIEHIRDWPWSSARWYLSGGAEVDPRLPPLHGPPPELYSPC